MPARKLLSLKNTIVAATGIAGSGARALLLSALLVFPLPLAAAPAEVQDLILEVRMDTAIVTPAAVVLERQGRYYLPLLELARNFEFVIDAFDSAAGTASGWYLREDQRFAVDRGKLEIMRAGKRIALSKADFLISDLGMADDIYIAQDALSLLWPEIFFSVDNPNMQLLVQSDATFPFMERRAREARQQQLAARQAHNAADENLPYIPNPYTALSKPVIDIDSSTRWRDDDDKVTGELSLSGVQDFMYMTADYGLTLNRDIHGFQRPDALRFTLSRQSTPDAPLPFGVEHVELGDTRLSHRDVIAYSTGGRGVYFTTGARDAQRQFDAITVDGTGPPGWEVELYRNDELIKFGFVDARGEYRFEDVTTQYGQNRLRVILYGPQGQVREESHDYKLSSTMLRPDEFVVSGGLVDADHDLIRFTDLRPGQPEGIAQNLAVGFGINPYLTGFASYNALPTQEGHHAYMSTGAAFSTGSGYGQVEALHQKEGGQAFDFRYLTALLGLRVNFASTFFRDFESPLSGFGSQAKQQETALKLNRTFALPFGSLGLQLDGSRIQRVNDDTEWQLGTRQSLSRGGFQLTHQSDTRLLNGDHFSSGGSWGALARFGSKWRLRSGLTYTYFPDMALTGGDAELRYQYSRDLTTALTLQHDFMNDEVGAGLQVGYDFKKFLGSVDTNWREQRGWEVILRASTSLGPYDVGGGYNMVSESQRRLTPVQAHTFLDRNLNNIFDEGDEALPETRLAVNNQISPQRADEQGRVVARPYHYGGLADIRLAASSLEDPYHMAAQPGYKMALRPGAMPVVDIPVIETGAIDGTVYAADAATPVQGITVQLLDHAGQPVMDTKAAYDGFYSFEFVRPGTYSIRLDPAQQPGFTAQRVTIAPERMFASGLDLHLPPALSPALSSALPASFAAPLSLLAPAAGQTP